MDALDVDDNDADSVPVVKVVPWNQILLLILVLARSNGRILRI